MYQTFSFHKTKLDAEKCLEMAIWSGEISEGQTIRIIREGKLFALQVFMWGGL